jgi:glycosyltransferase involved in cell wall biosynthesis
VLRWFERWLLQRADWVVASSDGSAVALRALWPAVEKKLTLVRDGVGSVYTRAAAVDRAAVPTIVYAGGMGPTKGFADVLEALAELRQRQVRFTALCIGQPTVAIQQRAAHLGLNSLITWQPVVPYEQIQARLASGDIGIDPKPPTSTEGSGKLLNYMAAGLTVVAYDSPSTRALVGDAGILVQPATPSALATALADLITRPERQAALAQAGQCRLTEQFLWNKLVEPLLTVYDQLARK